MVREGMKIMLGLLAMLVVAGCAKVTESKYPTKSGARGADFSIEEFNGHRYVIYAYHPGVAMVHDPDCPCKKVKP